MIFFSFNNERCVFAQPDQIASKLHQANTAVGQAFNAVLEAEKAGGNVTELLAKLNTAGDLLAGAQNALNSGNSANIASNLENVRLIANQISVDAVNLRNVSLVNSQNFLWLTLTFSVAGAVFFVFFLLAVWRRFKRGSIKKLLETKPEVVENTL
jgi:predicted PurR-regulated permease PerM